MNRSRQDTLLGIVFFGGLATLLWGTTVLTDLTFDTRPELRVLFRDISGLRAGDQTYVLGHKIGLVKVIEYQPDTPAEDRIIVTLQLEHPLALNSDVTITILDASLLGAKRIEIDPGVSPTPWPNDQVLRGQIRKNGIDAVGDLISGEDFMAIISGLRAFVDNLESPDTTIGKLMTESTLYDEATAAMQSARRSLEELEKSESSLGRLIYGAELGKRLESAITRLDNIAGRVDSGQGALGMLINNTAMAQNLDQGLASIRSIAVKIDSNQSVLGRLVNDIDLGTNLDLAVIGVRDFFEKATDPEAGLVGAAVANPALRERFVKIVDDLAAITDEARNGTGLLNQLIYNEGWSEKLDRIFTQVSRAIEDAREAAPVGTFFQVIAGAF